MLNISQEQQLQIVGGTQQGDIPPQQNDPSLLINTAITHNGALSISSNLDYNDGSIKPIRIPITQVASLFQQTFDNAENNFSVDDNLDVDFRTLVASTKIQMPNLAHYIGYIVTGTEIDSKYLESINDCARLYLEGEMEILPSGTFHYLNQRRDGSNRRYSQLCQIIYYSTASVNQIPPPNHYQIISEMQTIIQYISGITDATSVLTTLNKFSFNGQEHDVTRSMLDRWMNTTPWHSLMFNSQAPMSHSDFLKLFFKVYSIMRGTKLQYVRSRPNIVRTQTIIPNSILFQNLVPTNMYSSESIISHLVPYRFFTFMKYFLVYLVHGSEIWPPLDDDNRIVGLLDDLTINSDDEELTNIDEEDIESELSYD